MVCTEDVHDSANILGGRFVLSFKDEGTDKEIWKDRFVVQVHKEGIKQSLVNDTVVSRQYYATMLLGMFAPILIFKTFSTAVTQVCLPSAEI